MQLKLELILYKDNPYVTISFIQVKNISIEQKKSRKINSTAV